MIAHELSHIKNYDMLTSTVAVLAVAGPVLLADLGLRSGVVGGQDRDHADGPSIGPLLAVPAVVLLALAPLAARGMRLAVRPEREFLADATGVQLTRYPPGLASALTKLRGDVRGRGHRDACHRAVLDRVAARPGRRAPVASQPGVRHPPAPRGTHPDPRGHVATPPGSPRPGRPARPVSGSSTQDRPVHWPR